MKEMRMLIHIPQYANDCSVAALKQMQHMVELLSTSLTVIRQWWQLDFDDVADNAVVYTKNEHNKEYWSAGWKNIRDERVAQASALIHFVNPHSRKEYALKLSAVLLSHAKYYTLPRDNGERWISLSMPSDMWLFIDQEAFIKCVKEAYVELSATYACVDEEAPIGGIYEGSFRLLSNASLADDVEEKLPGIYWMQIISPSFVKMTGKIGEISMCVPCECTEVIEHKGKESLLMQISSDHKDSNRKRRLELRNFFKDSLNEISLDNILLDDFWNLLNWRYMNAAHKANTLRRLKMIPLTDEEISKITEMLDVIA